LPGVVTFAGGNTVAYGYDAAGTKLSAAYTSGGTTAKTEYAGNKVYNNGTLGMFLTEEGYLSLSGTTPAYFYCLKDHQGNNRVVLSQAGAVEQVNHSYPFGGLFGEGVQTSGQPYRYNGKELDRKFGLDFYDYGARHYDAALGAWTTADPLAEKRPWESPYCFTGNNPVNRIDPTGLIWDDVKEAEKLKQKIDNKITALNEEISKNQAKIDKGGLSDKKAAKLENKISATQDRISRLETSITDIDRLGADPNNIYALSSISGGEHHVQQGSDGKVYIQTSSDALSLHEIAHVRQSLDAGGLEFQGRLLLNASKNKVGITANEVEAYRIQYSYDLSFPGNTGGQGIKGINVHSVGGIMNSGKPVYPLIYQYSIDINKEAKRFKKLIRGTK
jgi:RHS repeat-associated protein